MRTAKLGKKKAELEIRLEAGCQRVNGCEWTHRCEIISSWPRSLGCSGKAVDISRANSGM